MTPADIKYASIYDSFTITVLMQLEDLGFCKKGEGGKFVADGNLISGVGRLPFNTDGGGLCNNHPTNRGGMTKVIEAAAAAGTMIEINGSPDRRDLNDVHARAAAEAGVRILVSSDAHSTSEFDQLRYGIATARRAWLTANHVANTRSFAEFQRLRKPR